MCMRLPLLARIASAALIAGSLVWLGAPARSQEGGPGYGPPGYGPPGYDGPPGDGPPGYDGAPGYGPPGYGAPGMGSGGMAPGDAGPQGAGPYGEPGAGRMGGYGAMGPGGGGPGDGEAGGSGEGLTMHTVSVHGAERPYYVHIPANVANPAPVVFMFHGGNGRPQAIAGRSGWNEEADQHGFIVVYPEGPPTRSGRGGTWNVGSNFGRVSSDDVAYVRAILQDLRRHEPIDPSRIYAAGHSMGGVFSYRLACEMSDTFAAIAPVSATMVESGCRPKSPVAVFHIHGTDDDRIPLAGGHGAMTAQDRVWPSPQTGIALWRRFDGCSGEPSRSTLGDESCETYDHCRATVEMCVRAGGTHPWPQGAAEQIWAFFAAHPKGAS